MNDCQVSCIEFKGNQSIVYMVVVLFTQKGKLLENINNFWIFLPFHLKKEYWKLVLSSISIYKYILIPL